MENISLCWRCNYREQDKSTGLCSECKNLISEKLFIHKCEEEFVSLMLKKSSSFEDDAWFDVKVDGDIYDLNLTYDLERKCHVVFVYKTMVRDGYRTTLTNEPIVGSFIPKEKLNYSFDN